VDTLEKEKGAKTVTIGRNGGASNPRRLGTHRRLGLLTPRPLRV
jgi:hypothetical protein